MSKQLAAVTAAKKTLAIAESGLRGVRSRRQILCSCGKRHPINKLELLVTHWYIEPHGCTEGDYWKEGEWQFVCPVTKTRNRLLFDDYDVPWDQRDRVGAEISFMDLYRSLFKSKRDTYRDDETGPTYNNYDVDRNRKRFELPPKSSDHLATTVFGR